VRASVAVGAGSGWDGVEYQLALVPATRREVEAAGVEAGLDVEPGLGDPAQQYDRAGENAERQAEPHQEGGAG
jgi:hypothetical protein